MSVKADYSVWNKIKKDLRKGKDLELNVGFFEDAVYPDGTQVAYVAFLNEEGHRNGPGAVFPDAYTPPRPFMRVGFQSYLKSNPMIFKKSVERLLEGQSTFTQEYKLLGPKLVSELKEIIDDWTSPPNSPATVDIKGEDNPLILSERMRNSVDFRVEKE